MIVDSIATNERSESKEIPVKKIEIVNRKNESFPFLNT